MTNVPLEPPDAIQPVPLQDEMERSFLDYAMSVIMSRALPDVRDGLKPVHRRIIWDMEQQGFRPDRPFVKCARVTGDTMARYHPHGDGAIYDALVRMAQPFSLRHPLIDFHGNYGSPDFGPAASRYTEARLHSLAMLLLQDIDENTVDMLPNYDGTTEEPSVLPARFPNLLVNGSQGIAVGMATSIPPHNMGEVIDATLHLIDNPDATPDDLMKFVKGPDFPTGGTILGLAGIYDAYRTGRGSVKVRAKASIEEGRRGQMQVVPVEEDLRQGAAAVGHRRRAVEQRGGERPAASREGRAALTGGRWALTAPLFDRAPSVADRRRALAEILLDRHDLHLAATAFFDAGLGAHLHRAAARAVGVVDAGEAEDRAARREVGALHELHQVVRRGIGVVDEVQSRVDDLAHVVGRDAGGHADGDALAAIDEQVREPRGQHRGFFGGAVVVRQHVDGVLVDVLQQQHGERVQACFGVTRGGGAEVGRAVVAVEVDQRVAQRERLGHAHECVVDGAVTVRVITRHRVAGDAGALHEGAVGPEALLLHVPDDAAVHRLQAVAHVGKGARHDDRHRVIKK